MKSDNIGLWYVLNHSVEQAEQLDNISIPDKQVVYEVIRIIEGVPLFLEDHYFRLKESYTLLGLKLLISEENLKTQIQKLIKACNQKNCNVKIMVYTDEQGQQNCLAYLSKYYYPSKEEIEKGVPVSLVEWEREHPNAKLLNTLYKETVSKKIAQEKVFEVLLVNSQNKITEGSRSNVFFVRGKTAFTAPDGYVLKGITRKFIFEACKKAGVEVIEKLVDTDELDTMEGVFISGTSIKVLPVSSIDGLKYPSGSHGTIIAVRNEFDRLIDEYIGKHQPNSSD